MVVWKQERANSPQRKVARQGKCCAFPSHMGASEPLEAKGSARSCYSEYDEKMKIVC